MLSGTNRGDFSQNQSMRDRYQPGTRVEGSDGIESDTGDMRVEIERELARSRPVTWQEAAAAFYGYGPIAKTLYRKLDSSRTMPT